MFSIVSSKEKETMRFRYEVIRRDLEILAEKCPEIKEQPAYRDAMLRLKEEN